jgi:peroxiredoxin family protein
MSLAQGVAARVFNVSRRVVFFVSNAGYEAGWQTASTGITAAAMGDEVIFVFSFEALRALAKGTFGKPLSDRERAEATRGEGLGAPLPGRMIQDARAMGARAIACDTTVKLCGLSAAELKELGVIDEVLGLPQIWRLTEDARVLTF